MITKYIRPRNGPAKSKWMRLHGSDGHSHEWNGVVAGAGRDSWQTTQDLTTFSMSPSIPGHQMYDLANAVILLTLR